MYNEVLIVEDGQTTYDQSPVYNFSDVKFATIRKMFGGLSRAEKSFNLRDVAAAFIALRQSNASFQFSSLAQIIAKHKELEN
jgi:hypothetical protein